MICREQGANLKSPSPTSLTYILEIAQAILRGVWFWGELFPCQPLFAVAAVAMVTDGVEDPFWLLSTIGTLQ